MLSSVLSSWEENALNYVLYISCGFSLIGTAFIISTFLLFPQTRTYGTRLVFFLSISDFFTSLSWFPWNLDWDLCQLQASILQFFLISSYLWSLSIAVSLFQVFFLEKQEEPRRTIIIYHITNWGYPLLTVILCLAYHKFGKAGSWCWIEGPQDFFRLLVYGPMVVIMVLICLNCIVIRIKMQGVESDFKKTLNRKLSLYLLAFVSSQLPAVINCIQNFLYPTKPIFALFLLQALLQPAQGFFNCLVYGFNEQAFIDQYKLMFNGCNSLPSCKCCQRKKKGKGDSMEEIPIFDYDYHSDEEEGS